MSVLLKACLLVAIAGVAGAAETSVQRPFSVDDLFELEDVGRYFGGPVAFSDDGRKLAFTRLRPKRTAVTHKWEGLRGNDRGDVWVQLEGESRPVNVTRGIEDGSGWWSPQWSPDARKLALLSTRGGNVRLWIWDAKTRLVRPITTSAVHFAAPGQPYVWVSPTQLLFASLSGDERSLLLVRELLTPALAGEAWSKARHGTESTASVLRSGAVRNGDDSRQHERLVLVDTSGVEKVIVDGSTRMWQLSPDRRAVSLARRLAFAPLVDEPLAVSFAGVWTVEVVDLHGKRIAAQEHISRDVVEQSMRWSPDGSELTFLSYGASQEDPPALYRLNARSGEVISHALVHTSATSFARGGPVQLEWTADDEILLLAASRDARGEGNGAGRLDYWRVRKDGTHYAVTRAMRTVPREVWPQDGRRRFIGLADGDLWSIEPASARVENLTARFEPAIDELS